MKIQIPTSAVEALLKVKALPPDFLSLLKKTPKKSEQGPRPDDEDFHFKEIELSDKHKNQMIEVFRNWKYGKEKLLFGDILSRYLGIPSRSLGTEPILEPMELQMLMGSEFNSVSAQRLQDSLTARPEMLSILKQASVKNKAVLLKKFPFLADKI